MNSRSSAEGAKRTRLSDQGRAKLTGLTWATGDGHCHPHRPHPERPERVLEVLRCLSAHDLTDQCTIVDWPGFEHEPSSKFCSLYDDAEKSSEAEMAAERLLSARLASLHNPFYLARFSPQRLKRLAAADVTGLTLMEEASTCAHSI